MNNSVAIQGLFWLCGIGLDQKEDDIYYQKEDDRYAEEGSEETITQKFR